MFHINIDKIGDATVIECGGKLDNKDDALRLRDAVTTETDAKIVVLDLSELYALENGGLGMLIFLQRWSLDHNIRLKVFNPSLSVRARLELVSVMSDFEIVSLPQVIALLEQNEQPFSLAA
jgi:anti-anti-sigma regulatory factor